MDGCTYVSAAYCWLFLRDCRVIVVLKGKMEKVVILIITALLVRTRANLTCGPSGGMCLSLPGITAPVLTSQKTCIEPKQEGKRTLINFSLDNWTYH